MPIFQSGGGQVGSSQITDDAIVNADVNSAAAIERSKLAAAVRVVATKSANQTQAASATKVTWDTEVVDTANAFASGTFTAPVAGWYNINCRINVLAQEGTPRPFKGMIYKNGGLIHSQYILAGGENPGNSCCPINETVLLAANDTIEIYHQTVGVYTISIVGGATESRLNIEYVSIP